MAGLKLPAHWVNARFVAEHSARLGEEDRALIDRLMSTAEPASADLARIKALLANLLALHKAEPAEPVLGVDTRASGAIGSERGEP